MAQAPAPHSGEWALKLEKVIQLLSTPNITNDTITEITSLLMLTPENLVVLPMVFGVSTITQLADLTRTAPARTQITEMHITQLTKVGSNPTLMAEIVHSASCGALYYTAGKPTTYHICLDAALLLRDAKVPTCKGPQCALRHIPEKACIPFALSGICPNTQGTHTPPEGTNCPKKCGDLHIRPATSDPTVLLLWPRTPLYPPPVDANMELGQRLHTAITKRALRKQTIALALATATERLEDALAANHTATKEERLLTLLSRKRKRNC